MKLSGLVDTLITDPVVAEAVRDARADGVTTLDLSAPAPIRPVLLAALAAEQNGADRPILAVTATFREAEELTEALQCLVEPGTVAYYPAWETLPHERLSPRSDTVGRRLAVLRRLVHPDPSDETTGPIKILVAPVRSVLQPQVAGLADLRPVQLHVGDSVELEDVVERLAGAAYHRVDLVERRGEFAVRGGIIDVFPPTEEHPLRVDFFGDDVEEIRYFAVADQRSLEIAEHGLWAPPCRELLLTDEVRARAAVLAKEHPELAELFEKLAEGHAVEGMESLAPVLVDEMELLVDLMPAGHPRRGQRPRAGPGPGARPGRDQPGVPGGVVGRCRRWWRGADRSGRGGVHVAGRRPVARAGQGPGLVEHVAVRGRADRRAGAARLDG